MLELSNNEARMLALSGLGLRGIPSATSEASATPIDVINHLGLLQIDSVNVFERAHFMPIFSRIGHFDKAAVGLFDAATPDRPAKFAEYWAHEASVIPIADMPLYKWRMDAATEFNPKRAQWAADRQSEIDWLKSEIAANGPMTLSKLDRDKTSKQSSWWGWSETKRILEWLFMTGELTTAGRESFSRRYALPEQVFSPELIAEIATSLEIASRKTLILKAIDVLAVATEKELSDYHRQSRVVHKSGFKRALSELLDAGDLQPVKVEGWKDKAYIGARGLRELEVAPTGTNPTTILSPFDPTVWYRDRAQNLFGFDYKIEIYTPAEKRIYGYYTLPILHNRKIVGRIDLKSDRQAGVLRVQSAWAEPWLDAKQTATVGAAVAKHLGQVKNWQGLSATSVEPVGTLAAAIAQNLKF